MSAKLLIVGLKEPVDLSDEEGKAADKMLADDSVLSETRFIIPGIVNVRKKDMRYVTFQKEIEYKNREPEPPLSTEERERARNEIEKASKWLKEKGIIKK